MSSLYKEAVYREKVSKVYKLMEDAQRFMK